jgi:hypothetical protein
MTLYVVVYGVMLSEQWENETQNPLRICESIKKEGHIIVAQLLIWLLQASTILGQKPLKLTSIELNPRNPARALKIPNLSHKTQLSRNRPHSFEEKQSRHMHSGKPHRLPHTTSSPPTALAQ